MSETRAAQSVPVRTASASVFVATLAVVLVATVLLLFVDFFLARRDRREADAHAEAEYAAGVTLLRAGHAADAAERFGAAVAVDRANVNYALALGEAMLAEGRVTDAEATLKALLDRAENDGAVNLTLAHVMVRENRMPEAKAYFHRAIFGRWGADSVARRTGARFELIDLLARQGAARELLAELLPFDETPPDSVVLRRRLGHLFILAGSPARAATMFRAVIHRDPGDADAYAGMGEAALALGNFQTAFADLSEAARLQPGDTRIARRLAVADTVLRLDPSARGISAQQRYARSRALLERTAATLGSCADGVEPSLADSARAMLRITTTGRREDVLGESMLGLATDLWTARPATCGAASGDNVLRLVQSRLAQ